MARGFAEQAMASFQEACAYLADGKSPAVASIVNQLAALQAGLAELAGDAPPQRDAYRPGANEDWGVARSAIVDTQLALLSINGALDDPELPPIPSADELAALVSELVHEISDLLQLHPDDEASAESTQRIGELGFAALQIRHDEHDEDEPDSIDQVAPDDIAPADPAGTMA